MYTEVFPLFLLLPVVRGGLGSTPQDIGLIMMIGAPSQLLGQLVAYPRLVRVVTNKRTSKSRSNERKSVLVDSGSARWQFSEAQRCGANCVESSLLLLVTSSGIRVALVAFVTAFIGSKDDSMTTMTTTTTTTEKTMPTSTALHLTTAHNSTMKSSMAMTTSADSMVTNFTSVYWWAAVVVWSLISGVW